jgi:hypothetical protein
MGDFTMTHSTNLRMSLLCDFATHPALVLAGGDAVAFGIHPESTGNTLGKREVISVGIKRVSFDEKAAGGIFARSGTGDELGNELVVGHGRYWLQGYLRLVFNGESCGF